jgi:hypothetical protein
VERFHGEISKVIISICNKEELPEQWKQSITVLIYKKGDKTDCSNYSGISVVATAQNCIQHPAVKVSSICRENH